MNTYLISWRPLNFTTVGLMLLVWVLLYVLISQGVRRLLPTASPAPVSNGTAGAYYGDY